MTIASVTAAVLLVVVLVLVVAVRWRWRRRATRRSHLLGRRRVHRRCRLLRRRVRRLYRCVILRLRLRRRRGMVLVARHVRRRAIFLLRRTRLVVLRLIGGRAVVVAAVAGRWRIDAFLAAHGVGRLRRRVAAAARGLDRRVRLRRALIAGRMGEACRVHVLGLGLGRVHRRTTADVRRFTTGGAGGQGLGLGLAFVAATRMGEARRVDVLRLGGIHRPTTADVRRFTAGGARGQGFGLRLALVAATRMGEARRLDVLR